MKSLIDDEIPLYKIFRLHKGSIKIILKLRKGTGIFRIFKIFEIRNNKNFHNFNKKQSKHYSVYRKIFRLLKIDLIIFSKLKLNKKFVDKIISKVVNYLEITRFNSDYNLDKESKLKNKTRLANNSFANSQFYTKLKIIVFFFCLLMLIFISDYSTIKLKINKESIQRINELENEYKVNNCESKGHLQALKVKCLELQHSIELFKKDGVSLLSVLIIWMIDNINHIYNVLGYSLFIYLTILIILFIKFI